MTQYEAKFIFNKQIPEAWKQLAIRDFVMLRQEAVNKINPLLDEWNKAFRLSMRIPGVKFLYNRYIVRHELEVLESINALAKSNPFRTVILDVDKNGDLFGRWKANRNITINLALKPMETGA